MLNLLLELFLFSELSKFLDTPNRLSNLHFLVLRYNHLVLHYMLSHPVIVPL